MKKIITHFGEQYNYYFLSKHDLLKLLKTVPSLIRPFILIMKQHNGMYWKLEHLQYEHNTSFSLITTTDNTTIVTILQLKKSTISNVHTTKQFQNVGFCKKNLQLLIKNTKLPKYRLFVDCDNLFAKKCYESAGFKQDSVRDGKCKMVRISHQ